MIMSALISFTCDKFGTTFLYLSVGGQPNAVASTIANAIQGGRRGLNSRQLLMKILSVTGKSRLDAAAIYFELESEMAHAHRRDYRYEIEFRPLRATAVRIFRSLPDGTEKIEFDGVLEAFLTSRFRLHRKPRGRTPQHYSSRAEYEEAYNSRTYSTPTPGTLVEQILKDRRRSPLTTPDLRGVTEFSKEEYFQRRRPKRVKK